MKHLIHHPLAAGLLGLAAATGAPAAPDSETAAEQPRPVAPAAAPVAPTDGDLVAAARAGHAAARAAVLAGARLSGDALAPGATPTLTVELAVADGWSITDAGFKRGAFVQLDPPAGVEPAGELLEDPRRLARNGFLVAPYEHTVVPGTHDYPLVVSAAPAADATLGINVVAYARRAADGAAFIVRHRLEVPMRPDARSRAGDPADSSWGGEARGDLDGLNVGDVAPDFALPRADGSIVRLADLRREGNVIVTTYRAFWWPFCRQQLVQLQQDEIHDAFDALDVTVIAVAQEDTDLESHGRFRQHFEPEPRFEIVADLARTDTGRYGRTTGYLIDRDGVVRQVMPYTVHERPDWHAVLAEARRLLGPTGG